MYDKVSGNGILNDFDLAHLAGEERPSGTERTGTIPFMAFDLLTNEAWDGNITRQYRHDCESFAWVLLWICCCYEDGNDIGHALLDGFLTGNFETCLEKKFTLFSGRIYRLDPTPSYDKRYLSVATELLYRSFLRRSKKEPQVEPTIDEVIEVYGDVLEKAGFSESELCMRQS